MRIAIVTESFLPSLNGVTTSVCRVLDRRKGRHAHEDWDDDTASPLSPA